MAFSLAIVVFERIAPHHVIKWYWRVVNPLWGALAGRSPGLALVETVGHRTGRSHQVPVGARSDGTSVWFVAAHASDSHYLRNIRKEPRVRVRIDGGWRSGMAHLLPDDDARRRALRVNPFNGWFTVLASSDLMTVRVDLD